MIFDFIHLLKSMDGNINRLLRALTVDFSLTKFSILILLSFVYGILQYLGCFFLFPDLFFLVFGMTFLAGFDLFNLPGYHVVIFLRIYFRYFLLEVSEFLAQSFCLLFLGLTFSDLTDSVFYLFITFFQEFFCIEFCFA